MSLDKRIQEAAAEADQYESTVHALITFSALVAHDGNDALPESSFGFGRRMDIVIEGDEQSSVPTHDHVTPDLVTQRSAAYGIVAEAKAGMAQGDDVWQSHCDQLRRYCTPLVGWWTGTETVEVSDAVLLVHRSRCRQLVKFVEDGTHILPADGAAIVEFVRSGQVATYYSFSMEWGSLRNGEVRQKLAAATAEVPLQKVIDSTAALQFYDAPPPMPMLLEIIWGELYGLIRTVEFDEKKRHWPIRVHVATFTEELQRAYGSRALRRDARSCEFPAQSWIRQALDELVSLELARVENASREAYTVFIRTFEADDLRSEFVRRMYTRRQSQESEQKPLGSIAEQTTLPLE